MWSGMDNRRLTRGLLLGIVLALLAVGLFIALWMAFGSAGLDTLPRLILALCIPPAVIAVLVGGFALLTRRRGS